MPENFSVFPRMISDFCRVRVSKALPPQEVDRLRQYMLDLFASGAHPPMQRRKLDWTLIGSVCGIDPEHLRSAEAAIQPGFDALVRELWRGPAYSDDFIPSESNLATAKRSQDCLSKSRSTSTPSTSKVKPRAARSGPKPRPIVEFPAPISEVCEEPESFSEALDLHMRRHQDTCWHLHRAVVRSGEKMDMRTITSWRRGQKVPRTVESLEVLRRIEQRYRLPVGYFRFKLPHPGRSASGHRIRGIGAAERRRLAWHLPDDFAHRPLSEQEKILDWVRTVIITGATEYRRYQAAAMKQRYSIRFPDLLETRAIDNGAGEVDLVNDHAVPDDPDLVSGGLDAPPQLAAEMGALIRFKTSTLTTLGYQRTGVWGEETASQKVEHLGLMFGALVARPTGPVKGFGMPLRNLTFGLLTFPSIWDWYLQWRERRRGFYTAWEVDMLRVAMALTRQETGWLRQSPELAARVKPIPGLVTQKDVDLVCQDWDAACDAFHKHATNRVKEIARVARVHRDPFEPILTVLEAESPVGEYRKITEEILRLMPDERRYPRAAAEAIRGFLLLRLGLHLGLRQKNLRQLLVCPRGRLPRSERQLNDLKRGELRWSDRDNGWEVFIPSIAFKNANSSYFGSKPFRLILPDLGRLYAYIEGYIDRHRRILLAGADDPGTFFVKTVKITSKNASYDQNTFYEAWRLVIQRYGIYNPYTGRGAIKGLLPHGPHNVRDVLATHILKQTGSYEQASYAIQDTPDMVAKHYGRFLPQDKAALAAQILNRVWEAA